MVGAALAIEVVADVARLAVFEGASALLLALFAIAGSGIRATRQDAVLRGFRDIGSDRQAASGAFTTHEGPFLALLVAGEDAHAILTAVAARQDLGRAALLDAIYRGGVGNAALGCRSCGLGRRLRARAGKESNYKQT